MIMGAAAMLAISAIDPDHTTTSPNSTKVPVTAPAANVMPHNLDAFRASFMKSLSFLTIPMDSSVSTIIGKPSAKIRKKA